ncbi:MAG: DUF305 domain-containing protein [Lachnospiraceae bacterium]|nr:DUF305 domain-containing protein [Lachnospiraceae bacterium]
MSKIKKSWMVLGTLAVLLIFIIAGTIFYNNCLRNPASEAAHLSSYLIEQDNIMDAMLENMTITPSGNAELDFLLGMVAHHQAAVELSHSYLNHGSSRKFKKLVREIIEEQEEEIEEMSRLADKLQKNPTDPEAYEIYMDSYNNTLSLHQHIKHGTSTDMTVEEAFAQGMVKHHQMAIDMANAVYNVTNNSEVQELAQDIVDMQTDEIQTILAVR